MVITCKQTAKGGFSTLPKANERFPTINAWNFSSIHQGTANGSGCEMQQFGLVVAHLFVFTRLPELANVSTENN